MIKFGKGIHIQHCEMLFQLFKTLVCHNAAVRSMCAHKEHVDV